DGVVDDLVDEVVQAERTGRADVHARALAYRLEALQDGDVLGVVAGGARRALSGRAVVFRALALRGAIAAGPAGAISRVVLARGQRPSGDVRTPRNPGREYHPQERDDRVYITIARRGVENPVNPCKLALKRGYRRRSCGEAGAHLLADRISRSGSAVRGCCRSPAPRSGARSARSPSGRAPAPTR